MSKQTKKYKKKTKYSINKTTEELTGTKIQYGSATYTLLCYAVMKSRMKPPTFSPNDVVYVLAGKFEAPVIAKRSLSVLLNAKCVEEISPNEWIATEKGINVRKIFAWYGNTVRQNQLYSRHKKSSSQKISWEDEIEINL